MSPKLPTFEPHWRAAQGVDLSDPEKAVRTLTERLDPQGAEGQALSQALCGLLEAGEVADRGEPPVRWSRVAKAGPDTGAFSIDVVHMNGAGPRHTHHEGEVNWCIALSGEPRFDGHGAGWVAFPPGSTHVPTVEGGEMLIVYLLPNGAVEFHA